MADKFFKSMAIAILMSTILFWMHSPLQASGLQMVIAKEKQKAESAETGEAEAAPTNINKSRRPKAPKQARRKQHRQTSTVTMWIAWLQH